MKLVRLCLFSFFLDSALTCESLEAPVNGQIRVRGTSVGSVALYTCNSGFMLEGDAFRTCQGNGEWSGEEPTCIREFDIAMIFMQNFIAFLSAQVSVAEHSGPQSMVYCISLELELETQPPTLASRDLCWLVSQSESV